MGARVLVAEDDAKQAKIIRFYLEREGHSVVVVHDGRAAIEECRQRQPDLAVLDVMMPKIDGLAVCRVIRAESDMPIVLLTARSTEDDAARLTPLTTTYQAVQSAPVGGAYPRRPAANAAERDVGQQRAARRRVDHRSRSSRGRSRRVTRRMYARRVPDPGPARQRARQGLQPPEVARGGVRSTTRASNGRSTST